MPCRHLWVFFFFNLSSQLLQMLCSRPAVHSGHLPPFVPGCDGRTIHRMKDRRKKIKVDRPTQPTIVHGVEARKWTFTLPLRVGHKILSVLPLKRDLFIYFWWEGQLHVQESMFVFVCLHSLRAVVFFCWSCSWLIMYVSSRFCELKVNRYGAEGGSSFIDEFLKGCTARGHWAVYNTLL